MASFEEFRLIRFLGSGSFGVVWEVGEEGEDYALKVILVHPENEERQKRELDISPKLDHPNLVKVVKVRKQQISKQNLKVLVPEEEKKCLSFVFALRRKAFTTFDIFCITSELCGETLREWLRIEHDPNSIETIDTQKIIIFNIIEGLKYLHEKKIIHRDLKPENVMFSTKGYILPVKIGDYGTCRILKDPQTSTLTSSVGTDLYLAPEARSNTYSFQSDLFSLGLLIWEVLQLLPTDKAGSYFEKLVFNKEKELVKLNPCFEKLKTPILKLCEKDVKERSQNIYTFCIAAVIGTEFTVSNIEELYYILQICEDNWTICLLEGSYNAVWWISRYETIKIKKNNIKLRGKGGEKTVLYSDFHVTGDNFTMTDFRIWPLESGIVVDGANCFISNLTISGYMGSAFCITAEKDVDIENVNFKCVSYPLMLRGDGSKLRNVTIHSCNTGVEIINCKEISIQSLSIYDPWKCGIVIKDNVTAIKLRNVKISSGSEKPLTGIRVTNCPKGRVCLRNVTCPGFKIGKKVGLFIDKLSHTVEIDVGSDCKLGKVVQQPAGIKNCVLL